MNLARLFTTYTEANVIRNIKSSMVEIDSLDVITCRGVYQECKTAISQSSPSFIWLSNQQSRICVTRWEHYHDTACNP